MKRYILYFLNILLVSVFTSCEVEDLKTTFEEKKANTLTLHLNVGGLNSRANVDGETDRNENLIQTLDCFFYTSVDGNAVLHKSATIPVALNGTDRHSVNISIEEDDLEDLFGSDYKTAGNGKRCYIYIIANLPESVRLTGNETIGALKSKTLNGSFATLANQANFVMDSGSPNENGEYVYDEITLTINDKTATLSGHVNLYRSAAKVGLYVRVPDQITNGIDEDETVWTPVSGSMTVKFHKGVNKANIDNTLYPYTITDQDYFDTGVCAFIETSSAITENGVTFNQTTEYPFYTYPTSTAEGQGTYFTLYLSWKSQTAGADTPNNTGDDQFQYKNCTYQIPVNKLEALERNNYYRLLLNVGVLGTESDVVTLEPSYTVLDWNDENIETDIEENVYLVVNEHNVTINNKNSYAVEFVSSHPVQAQIVSITQPYYVSPIASTTIFYNKSNGQGIESVDQGTPGTVLNNSATPSLYKECSVSVDNNTNTIVLNHEVVNMGADGAGTNYDIAPYTIKVYVKMVYGTGANQYFEDTIEFTQYPAIYVVANQNSDYEEGDSRTEANENHNMMVNSYYGGSSNSDGISNMTKTQNNGNTIGFFGTAPGLWVPENGGNSDTNVNPNMYVINITSMSDNTYTIGDPRELNIDTELVNTTENNNSIWANAVALYDDSPRTLSYYYPTDKVRIDGSTSESPNPDLYKTGNTIAPKIRVASSYSVTHNTNSPDRAERRCASYQEDGYPAGRWRMPTYAEAKFIYTLSYHGKIPALFNANTNYWCAHGDFLPNSNGQVALNPSGSASSIRCVYDEWYWGSEPAVQKGTNGRDLFTWGDYPRDAWPPSGN